MSQTWLKLADIPAEGRDFSFDDPALWSGPAAELGLQIEVAEPLRAEVSVTPQGDGFSVRGTLRGEIALPCDRCAEPLRVLIDERFHEFEVVPDEDAEPGEDEDESRIEVDERGLVLDIGAILWEQLMLALPVKPLCREDCQGLCPGCGQNLNEGPCDCAHEELDPRLDALRQMKIS